MKIVALLGSSRRSGNIAKMLELFTVSAEQRGMDAELINLYDINMKYCNGCMACRKTGICIIDDEFAYIREKIIACDALALAAPVYFANVPAVVKNLFDRLAGAVMDDNNSSIPRPKLSKNQRYVLMTACTTPFPFDYLCGQSKGAIRAMDEVFHTGGMRRHGKIILAGSRNKRGLPKHIEAKIKKLAQSL